MSLVLPGKNVPKGSSGWVKAGIFRKMPARFMKLVVQRELYSLSNLSIFHDYFFEIFRHTPNGYPQECWMQ
jgi:hypothetical protein